MAASSQGVVQRPNRSVNRRLRPAMGMACTLAITTLVWVAALGTRVHAQCEQAKLTAADAAREDYFGASVAIDGDVAVIGAAGWCLGCDPGAAYVFRRYESKWGQQQKLLPSDLQPGSSFGWAVAVSGNTIVVTAPNDSDAETGAGAVYVFRYNGVSWMETQKLYPSDAFLGWHLGWSVALDGDVAAVGQIGDSFAGAPESGAVYVYRWNGSSWVQEQKLAPPDLGPYDHFGWSVSVSENVIVGGAPLQEGGGAAFVFRWNGGNWAQQQKLTRSQGEQGGGFAKSVAVWGDSAFVGSPENGAPNYRPGTVSIFRYNGLSWLETQTLTASDGGPADFFGGSLTAYGDQLLVTASPSTDPGQVTGIVYFFEFESAQWVERRKLTASDAAPNDGFGPVGLGEGLAIVGAAGDDDACPTAPYCNSGSAYIFDIPLCVPGIPAVSPWGLVSLALSVLAVGMLLLRKRGAFAQEGLRRKDAVPKPVKEIDHEKNTCPSRRRDPVGHSRDRGGRADVCASAPSAPAADQTGGSRPTAV